MYFCQDSSERANDGVEAHRQEMKCMPNVKEKERERKQTIASILIKSLGLRCLILEPRGNPVTVISHWAMTEALSSSHVTLSLVPNLGH